MTHRPVFIFAHGAGKGIHSDWITALGQILKSHNIDFRPFEFPYMMRRHTHGKQYPPDRLPTLQQAYTDKIPTDGTSVYIGGKSMGGRVATTIADTHANIRGCIVYGYPFHPPGKPENVRTAHLHALKTPTLILQGTNDPFGKQHEWAGFCVSKNIRIHPMAQANHDLKPLKSTGYDLSTYLIQAGAVTADFIHHLENT